MYVLRTFAMTSPSLVIPTPILLALPSKPIDTTIFGLFQNRSTYFNRQQQKKGQQIFIHTN